MKDTVDKLSGDMASLMNAISTIEEAMDADDMLFLKVGTVCIIAFHYTVSLLADIFVQENVTNPGAM